MKCEICDEQTATMWVQRLTTPYIPAGGVYWIKTAVQWTGLSCDDCGPQLGYKILAPLTSD